MLHKLPPGAINSIPVDTRDVFAAVNSVRDSVAAIFVCVEALETRLQPIVRQEEDKSAPEPTATRSTALGLDLECISSQAQSLRNRLSRLIDRLEV